MLFLYDFHWVLMGFLWYVYLVSLYACPLRLQTLFKAKYQDASGKHMRYPQKQEK